MKNAKQINEAIRARKPYRQFDDRTYINEVIWDDFCNEHKGDYKYVAIFGKYKVKYHWTKEECQMMYDKSPDSWCLPNGEELLYDWGKGKNKVVSNFHDQKFHIPELDHIISRDECAQLGWTEKQTNHPSNMQVIPGKLNKMKSDLTKEEAILLIPMLLDLFKIKIDISHT
jgi:hypothetical protein